MINPKVVKAILNFYLQSRGITELPSNETLRKKVDYLCSVNNSVEKHFDKKDELLKLCKNIAEQEVIEENKHHSNKLGPVTRAISDFPFMACALRAVRSYIMHTLNADKLIETSLEKLTNELAALEANLKKTAPDAAHENMIKSKREQLALFKLAHYHKCDLAFYNNAEYGFLDVIKYETNTEELKDLKHIKNFNDFYNFYCPPGKKKDKEESPPFSTLERLTKKWRKSQNLDLSASVVSVTQFSVLANNADKGKTKADKKADKRAKHEAHEAAEAKRLEEITAVARPGQ